MFVSLGTVAGGPFGRRGAEKADRRAVGTGKVFLQAHKVHAAIAHLHPLMAIDHIGHTVLNPQRAVECHLVNGRGREFLLEGKERAFGFLGPENLRAAVSVWRCAFRRFLPVDIGVQRGKEVIFALVFMHLGGPYRTGKVIVPGHIEHADGSLPSLQVGALVSHHATVVPAVLPDGRGGVHIIHALLLHWKDKGVTDVDVLQCVGLFLRGQVARRQNEDKG